MRIVGCAIKYVVEDIFAWVSWGYILFMCWWISKHSFWCWPFKNSSWWSFFTISFPKGSIRWSFFKYSIGWSFLTYFIGWSFLTYSVLNILIMFEEGESVCNLVEKVRVELSILEGWSLVEEWWRSDGDELHYNSSDWWGPALLRQRDMLVGGLQWWRNFHSWKCDFLFSLKHN